MTRARAAQLHGTAVSFGEKGLLLLGPSGSGKSALALELIAIGAQLVADDRVDLRLEGEEIVLSRPPTLPKAIEARGVGLIAMHGAGDHTVALTLVVDLGTEAQARLPEPATMDVLGQSIPLLHNVPKRYFPGALKAYVLNGPFVDPKPG